MIEILIDMNYFTVKNKSHKFFMGRSCSHHIYTFFFYFIFYEKLYILSWPILIIKKSYKMIKGLLYMIQPKKNFGTKDLYILN